MNTQLHTPAGFPVYGGQIVIPTVADIDADGYLDYFVGIFQEGWLITQDKNIQIRGRNLNL
ncbi:MAG: hypothetical protein CM1200mP10_14080 [Candidatus Neomarinimicrobiota bacterium]|nr:MAG: hypothetical protein CM1200mP10_14080 [Candidatus Neomarinimicrobiota bacterium]